MDFANNSFEAQILAENADVTVTIPIVNDQVNEAEQFFVVNLETLPGVSEQQVRIVRAASICKIVDNDSEFIVDLNYW